MIRKKHVRPLHLLLVAGARPNFMKIAPLIKAIGRYNRSHGHGRKLRYSLIHTGQHYDIKMSGIFFRDLGIPLPSANLEVGSGSHAEQTGKIMPAFEQVCLREKPDWVVVVGDVNSTMACTLVASKIGVKVAHVEAGLRSFDRTMPEEINRVVTDALADLLLTPSEDADENLRHEGIPDSRVRLVGNIMIDTLLANLQKAVKSRLPNALGLVKKGFVYVTLHRPANVDDPRNLDLIMRELIRLSGNLPVVFPVHPRTQKMFKRLVLNADRAPHLKLIEPVGYYDSTWLTRNARLVLTDSGGLQEESTFFRTPCLTLRPNTERPITLTVGTNKLTSLNTLAKDIDNVLRGRCPKGRTPKYWDGHTAERVLRAILSFEGDH